MLIFYKSDGVSCLERRNSGGVTVFLGMEESSGKFP